MVTLILTAPLATTHNTSLSTASNFTTKPLCHLDHAPPTSPCQVPPHPRSLHQSPTMHRLPRNSRTTFILPCFNHNAPNSPTTHASCHTAQHIPHHDAKHLCNLNHDILNLQPNLTTKQHHPPPKTPPRLPPKIAPETVSKTALKKTQKTAPRHTSIITPLTSKTVSKQPQKTAPSLLYHASTELQPVVMHLASIIHLPAASSTTHHTNRTTPRTSKHPPTPNLTTLTPTTCHHLATPLNAPPSHLQVPPTAPPPLLFAAAAAPSSPPPLWVDRPNIGLKEGDGGLGLWSLGLPIRTLHITIVPPT